MTNRVIFALQKGGVGKTTSTVAIAEILAETGYRVLVVDADHIVIPQDGGDLAMDALLRFTEFVDPTRDEGHTNAEILGIFITMRDRRSKYERDIAAGVREAYGDLVFDTEVRRKVRLKEMSAEGINTIDEAMDDYIALAEEITKRIDHRNSKGEA